ncbi:hypothetical protein EK21DRAFT_81320 [Setomelanomma holmii]|uniref:Uncharacterized protein n=1 Tax=Setomelanomma holmii TaxID=210430 RepID=A0A9P4LFK5_9PLEO|nr:hypothetical protein EK21DRAFT_81320 [Setomelanomma holmii]
MRESPAPFWPFGVTLAAICIPFFSIIGFLSTKYGYHVWATNVSRLWRFLFPKKPTAKQQDFEAEHQTRVTRTMSKEEGMRSRLREQELGKRRESRPVPSHPHIQRMVERMGEGRQSGLRSLGIVADGEKKEDASVGKNTMIDV